MSLGLKEAEKKMTYEIIKQEVLERAKDRLDWGMRCLSYGPDNTKLLDLTSEEQQDLVDSIRERFIAEDEPERLREVIWFAESCGLEYPTKEEDLIASAEAGLCNFGFLAFYALSNDYRRAVAKELNENIEILEARVSKEQLSQIVQKALEIYSNERDRLQEDGKDGYILVERLIEVGQRTLEKYIVS